MSAIILRDLKDRAEAHLGEEITEAVITVPANFNSVQRQATKDAGEIAGLKILRVINEPTAAALHYGHAHDLSAVLLVFDLGGGTFDISVVEAAEGMYEVVHSHGDNQLGGDDFNIRIVGWIVETFAKQTGRDIRRDVPAMQLVHEWAIAAKHQLTDSPEVQLSIPNLHGGASFEGILTREMYRSMCSDLLDKLRSVAKSVKDELAKPKYAEAFRQIFANDMAGCDVLLVGGETRVPCVRELVSEVFRGRIHTDIHPDHAVALGAAIQAGIILRSGDVKDIVLVDTTALPLGTEVKGGLFSKIIEANTPIPCSRTSEYSPVEDFQRAVLINVFQGESELVEKNVKLGEFEFLLQPPRRRHEAAIQLTFHLDADDILHVSAVDKKTRNTQHLTIKDSQNLSPEALARMKAQAESGRDEDAKRVARIRRHNQLSEFVTEVLLRHTELAKKDPDNKFLKKVERYAVALTEALSRGDDRVIAREAANLEEAWAKLLEATPSEAPPSPEAPSPGAAVCANCGARGVAGFAFCGKCGSPLAPDKCPRCGAALVEGFVFCGKCGHKVA